MRRTGALAAMLLAPSIASAQPCSTQWPGARQVESARYQIGYRSHPERIEVGKHFSLELVLCAKPGMPAPESLSVDAHMPEHRHGMNYKAQVNPLGSGRYRVEGLLFHMPGRWEFVFDVRAGGRSDRATPSFVLE